MLDAGWDEGLEAGERAGFLEGRSIGVVNGHRIGYELGFLLGAAEACRMALGKTDPRWEKIEKALDGMEAAVKAVPTDPTDESLQEAMAKARARMRLLNALLPAHQRIPFGVESSKLQY